jgi:hypothetical protein
MDDEKERMAKMTHVSSPDARHRTTASAALTGGESHGPQT